ARAVTLTRTLVGPDRDGDTTNLAVVDAEGNTCVVTSSLGLGSGDFVPRRAAFRARAGPPSEQHAGGGRPDPRSTRARRADGEHDVPATGSGQSRSGARGRGGRRGAPARRGGAGGRRDPGRGARAGRGRLSTATPPGRWSGQSRARVRRRRRAGARAARDGGPPMAGASPPLSL